MPLLALDADNKVIGLIPEPPLSDPSWSGRALDLRTDAVREHLRDVVGLHQVGVRVRRIDAGTKRALARAERRTS